MRLAPHGRCSSLHRDQGSKALPAPVQHRAPNRAQPRCLPENVPRPRQSRRRCGYHRSAAEARNRGQLGLLDRRQPSRQRAKEVPETPSRSHSPLLPRPRSLGLPVPPTQQSGDDLEQQSTANRASPENSRACSRPDRAPPVRSRRSGRALSSLDERARGTRLPRQDEHTSAGFQRHPLDPPICTGIPLHHSGSTARSRHQFTGAVRAAISPLPFPRSVSTCPPSWLEVSCRSAGTSAPGLTPTLLRKIDPDRLLLDVLVIGVDRLIASTETTLFKSTEGRGVVAFAVAVH